MERIPSWGRVTAQPHEFLIQIRDGKVRRSGQGVSCFKMPGDSVTLIPTSISKLSFRADQVTLEKTGVEVTGLAVYRIVEPLLAYRMIDQDRGSMTEILRDMFVGATRRIVAGLTLEECITHRKERVAAALMQEIAPVLSGEGSLGDTTAHGWGVVIDTIEIQDVRVLSQEVFARLQAPFREKLALEALEARSLVSQREAQLEAEKRRAAEQARRQLMAEEEARIQAERQREVAAQQHKEAQQQRSQEAELVRQQRSQEAELVRQQRSQEAELLRARERAEADAQRAQIEMATRREAGELEAALLRLSRESAGDLSEARLTEVMLTETLPKVAESFRGSFDKITVSSPGGDLFAFLSSGLEQVMGVAGSRGVRLPREAGRRPPPEG
jgi:regulator of protease activity HflC (stomatin/prohibitin superfamily)